MFENIGSWLDWKKAEVSAAMSSMAFNHHVDKIQRDTNNKSFSNGTSTTYSKCAPAATSSKPVEEKKQYKKEEVKKPETKKPAEEESKKETKVPDINLTEGIDKAIEKIDLECAGLKNIAESDEDLKELIASVKKYQERKAAKAKKAEKLNVPAEVDPAETEHPEEDAPEIKVINLNEQDSKHILDVIYQVCFENAEELLKHNVSDEDMKNLSKEEIDKRNKEYDSILLTLIARELTGLKDVSDVDLKQLEKDLNTKAGEANITGCIQTAFTTYVNNKVPEGKPLDLSKGTPMEIVADEEEPEPTPEPAPQPEPTPAATTSGSKKGGTTSRRKR